ncbi:MAG: DUF721 domain-containing protein [Devosiaceae bacterium]
MKGRPTKAMIVAAPNVRGQLLGHEIQTKAAVPTSARAIGAEVGAVLKPLQHGKAARSKFVSPALLSAWPEIVGERLAGLCMPVQMKAKPKSRSRHKKVGDDGAVLEVRADPSVKIDIDYGQALLVERINAFFGYHAVASLKMLEKPMQAQRAAPQIAAKQREPGAIAKAQANAKQAVAPVQDDDLRAALERLGAAVLIQAPSD